MCTKKILSMKSCVYSIFKMRNFLIVALLFATCAVQAQSVETLFSNLKSANAAGVAKQFDTNVEITLLNKAAAYSKAQAEAVLRDFFKQKKVHDFELKHQGASPEGSKYFVGNLKSAAGNYSIYIYGKNVSTSFVIRELRIED